MRLSDNNFGCNVVMKKNMSTGEVIKYHRWTYETRNKIYDVDCPAIGGLITYQINCCPVEYPTRIHQAIVRKYFGDQAADSLKYQVMEGEKK